MVEDNSSDVTSAFGILLDEIDAEIDRIKEASSELIKLDEYKQARKVLARAEKLGTFRDRVAALREEWERLITEDIDDEREYPQRRKVPTKARREKGKLPPGIGTPKEVYRLPILRTLVEMGGSARSGDVLDRVFEIMKPILKEVDYLPIPSNPSRPRWRATAEWVKLKLVHEGLMKKHSPPGIWEISEKGRKYLESVSKDT